MKEFLSPPFIHLFIHSINHLLYQCGYTPIYFIPWVTIQYYCILLLKSFLFWPLRACSDWLLKFQNFHCALEKEKQVWVVVPGNRVKALDWERVDSSLSSEPTAFVTLSQSLASLNVKTDGLVVMGKTWSQPPLLTVRLLHLLAVFT